MKLQVIKTEAQTSENQEIKPPAKCLCCMDTGRAANRFLSEFVDIPANGDFLPYICKRYDCEAGERLIVCYEKSDQERDAAWSKLADKDPSVPKFMRQRDYQANWSCALPASACESMHKWALDEWIEVFVKKVKPTQFEAPTVFNKYAKSVEDRKTQILNIVKAITDRELQGLDLTSRISATLKKCSDRDDRSYQDWQLLPDADHQRMLEGIRSLTAS